jgi:hypothetical protein
MIKIQNLAKPQLIQLLELPPRNFKNSVSAIVAIPALAGRFQSQANRLPRNSLQNVQAMIIWCNE